MFNITGGLLNSIIKTREPYKNITFNIYKNIKKYTLDNTIPNKQTNPSLKHNIDNKLIK